MKHSERREMKDRTARRIQDICDRVRDQKKVLDRVMKGDYMSVVEWKDSRDEILKLSQKQFEKLSLNKMAKELEKAIDLSKYVY